MICPACEYNNLPGSEYCGNCYGDLTQLDQPVTYDRVERSLMFDPVSVLEPREAATLPPDATVGEAVHLLLERNIGAVPIIDEAGRLLGIFSERDLLLRVAGQRPDYASRPISEYMTPNPETVRESDTLALVLHKIHIGGYRHLPVLRQGRVLGMISIRDILRHVTSLYPNCFGAEEWYRT
jgi:CBS domain-containing protein